MAHSRPIRANLVGQVALELPVPVGLQRRCTNGHLHLSKLSSLDSLQTLFLTSLPSGSQMEGHKFPCGRCSTVFSTCLARKKHWKQCTAPISVLKRMEGNTSLTNHSPVGDLTVSDGRIQKTYKRGLDLLRQRRGRYVLIATPQDMVSPNPPTPSAFVSKEAETGSHVSRCLESGAGPNRSRGQLELQNGLEYTIQGERLGGEGSSQEHAVVNSEDAVTASSEFSTPTVGERAPWGLPQTSYKEVYQTTRQFPRFPELDRLHLNMREPVASDMSSSSVIATRLDDSDLESEYDGISRSLGDEPWEIGVRGKYDVSLEVYRFYQLFADKATEIYSNLKRPNDETRAFSPQYERIVHQCLLRRFSRKQIEDSYDTARITLMDSGALSLGLEPDLLRHFPSAKSFSDRVVLERRMLIKEQGWRVARIAMKGEAQIGFFIPIADAVSRIISEHGGVDQLVRYSRKNTSCNQRVYSHPIHCNAMRLDSSYIKQTLGQVYVSIYCDGTQVAQCGSTECCVFRIRIENLPGASHLWTDVGIAPLLVLRKSNPSAAEKTNLRLELFQRFSVLLLESASTHSQTDFDKLGLEIRILPSSQTGNRKELLSRCTSLSR